VFTVLHSVKCQIRDEIPAETVIFIWAYCIHHESWQMRKMNWLN